jgi:hypothetical protein
MAFRTNSQPREEREGALQDQRARQHVANLKLIRSRRLARLPGEWRKQYRIGAAKSGSIILSRPIFVAIFGCGSNEIPGAAEGRGRGRGIAR